MFKICCMFSYIATVYFDRIDRRICCTYNKIKTIYPKYICGTKQYLGYPSNLPISQLRRALLELVTPQQELLALLGYCMSAALMNFKIYFIHKLFSIFQIHFLTLVLIATVTTPYLYSSRITK